jgi:hypothetical protein
MCELPFRVDPELPAPTSTACRSVGTKPEELLVAAVVPEEAVAA